MRAATWWSPLALALVALAIGALAAPASAAESMPDGWSAGPVARWAGYASRDSLRVREVQRTLRRLDYRPGPVDGLFGPLTEGAVLRFQRTESLRPDGIVGPRTLRRLRVRNGERPRSTTKAPRSGARSPGRPSVAPTRPPRTAPAPSTRPAEPAGEQGPSVSPWLALPALAAFLIALMALVGRARQRARSTVHPPAAPEPVPVEPPSDPSWSGRAGRPPAEPLVATSLDDADAFSRVRLNAALRDRAEGVLIAAPRGAYTQDQPRLLRIEACGQEVLAKRRWRSAGRVVPVSTTLFAEGHSADPSIGDFAGMVCAMALPGPAARTDGREAAPRYRVNDVTKPAPVWVREDEIVRRSVEPGRPAGPVSARRAPENGTAGRAASAAPVTSLALVMRNRRHRWMERTE